MTSKTRIKNPPGFVFQVGVEGMFSSTLYRVGGACSQHTCSALALLAPPHAHWLLSLSYPLMISHVFTTFPHRSVSDRFRIVAFGSNLLEEKFYKDKCFHPESPRLERTSLPWSVEAKRRMSSIVIIITNDTLIVKCDLARNHFKD